MPQISRAILLLRSRFCHTYVDHGSQDGDHGGGEHGGGAGLLAAIWGTVETAAVYIMRRNTPSMV